MNWNAASQLTIALLDDHAMIRHGMLARLSEESDFRVVGSFANSRDLITALHTTKVDLLLLDYELAQGDIDGLNLIRVLGVRFPMSKILVVSSHHNQATVTLALRAGARGFVGKTQPLTDLIGAIRTVALGRFYVDKKLAFELAPLLAEIAGADFVASDAPGPIDNPLMHQADLSSREREVLLCCLDGMSVTQIAEKFERSVKTISTQKRTAFRKLGIGTDNELFKIHHQLRVL
ncbi:response regulator [Glaciimonas soli]|uniref:Response regulator n=1 Tax=Glaciimonas soli TaxID=2590999 RepID=A0A843YXL4_9BURK|nr:response regulator transcription factor [Glaciimonas soli]MQR02493.1 response regulator [Glaciimonas soli]